MVTLSNEIDHPQNSNNEQRHHHRVGAILGGALSKTGFDLSEIEAQHDQRQSDSGVQDYLDPYVPVRDGVVNVTRNDQEGTQSHNAFEVFHRAIVSISEIQWIGRSETIRGR